MLFEKNALIKCCTKLSRLIEFPKIGLISAKQIHDLILKLVAKKFLLIRGTSILILITKPHQILEFFKNSQ